MANVLEVGGIEASKTSFFNKNLFMLRLSCGIEPLRLVVADYFAVMLLYVPGPGVTEALVVERPLN
jgi:hypothetical protein